MAIQYGVGKRGGKSQKAGFFIGEMADTVGSPQEFAEGCWTRSSRLLVTWSTENRSILAVRLLFNCHVLPMVLPMVLSSIRANSVNKISDLAQPLIISGRTPKPDVHTVALNPTRAVILLLYGNILTLRCSRSGDQGDRRRLNQLVECNVTITRTCRGRGLYLRR